VAALGVADTPTAKEGIVRYIGLDIGTTTVSAVALAADGTPLQSRTVPNDADAHVPAAGAHHRQDPERIEQLCREALAAVGAPPAGGAGGPGGPGGGGTPREPIGGIGLTGQMHGIVYLDRHGRPVSPLYTWRDGSGDLPLPGDGGTYAARLAALTGHSVPTGYGLATHFYLSLTGGVPAEATGFATIGDYIGARLAGLDRPRSHPSLAASLGLFDPAAGGFDLAAFAAAGLDPAMAPRVDASETPIGEWEGIPITPALGDNQASFLGAMRTDTRALVNVGTGAQVSALTGPGGAGPMTATGAAAVAAAGLEYRPFLGREGLLVGSSLCGGSAYALLHDLFAEVIRVAGGTVPPDLYERLNAAAEAGLASPARVVVDTRLQGTRLDPGLTGGVTGLRPATLTVAALAAGVLRGIVTELHDFYGGMARLGLAGGGQGGGEAGGRPGGDDGGEGGGEAGEAGSVRIVGSGNAVRLNAALRQAIREQFGPGLAIPAHTEEAAFGAALFAMLVTGHARDRADLDPMIRYLADPDPDAAA
jgi:sedoheptulokinase